MRAESNPAWSTKSEAKAVLLKVCVIALCCVLALGALAHLAAPRRAEASAQPSGDASTAAAVSALTSDEATVWYLAEGYTGGEFDTWVLVQNPGTEDAVVTLSFQLPPGTSADPFSFHLPAGTRQSIKLDDLPGLAGTDVSTTVTATGPVVAERAMYFNYNGKPGGHDSIGVKYPSSEWFLAEGYTGGDFDTWVLVQNPGAADTTVTMDFQLPSGSSAPSHTLDLPAGTRRSVHLDELPGLESTDVSVKVSSPIAVVAERAMYFDYQGRRGGHNSAGVTHPSLTWYLAEGYTGGDFDTWVLVQNPGSEAAVVTLSFQLPPGFSAPSYSFPLAAGTRFSVHLDDLPGLAGTDVSTTVSADRPVVAERAMYFNYSGKMDGHDSTGAMRPECDWYLAEGYTGGEFDTWVLVQNPGVEDKRVTLHFQLPPGSSADPYTFNLPAGTRMSVNLDILPGLAATDVSTWVDADGPVVAERAVYFDYEGRSGGHCSIGALYEPPLIPATTKVLGEGDIKLLEGVADAGDKRVITFAGSTETLAGLAVGDVILSDAASAPEGFLYKIVGVDRGGGKTTLTVVAAGLEEAIWRGHISLAGSKLVGASASVSGADASAAGAAAGASDAAAGSDAAVSSAGDFSPASLLHFDRTMNVTQKIGTGSNYVDLTGSVGISMDLDFSIDINYTAPSVEWVTKYSYGIPYAVVPVVTPPSVQLRSVSFGASFTENVAIDVTVHGDFSVDQFVLTIPGTKIDLTRIKFMAGPVPVWLTPYVQLAVGADGNIDLGVTAGVTQSATVAAGCAYNSASGWSNTKSFSNTFSVRPPTLAGSFSNSDITFSFGPQVGILLYDIVGPYINVLPGVRMTLDPNTANPGHPLWGLYAALAGDIGVKFGIEVGIYKWVWTLWLVNVKFRVIDWSTLLAKTVRIYSLAPTKGAVGSEVAVKGVNFGGSRENDSFVSFGNKQATEYTQWSDGTVKCKVPSGIYGTVDVTVTRIFHDWNILGTHLQIKFTSNARPFQVDSLPEQQQVIRDWMTSQGLNPDGWVYKGHVTSASDPSWALFDYQRFEGMAHMWFMLRFTDGAWRVVHAQDDAFNPQDYGAPADLHF